MDKKEYSLTEGSILKGMLVFAIPIFFSNLFQQLYNAVDSLIVGNFLGAKALAAVSSSGNLIFLLTGFVNGVSMGAGVVIARFYGAKDDEKLKRSIHTAVALAIFFGIALSVTGVILTPHILKLMGTPSDVINNSIIYFRVYFMGCLSVVMYNFGSSILQSVGDSKHPMIYLISASILNVILDLIFIGIFKMGVGSAAFATIISQTLSAVLAFVRLIKLGRFDVNYGLKIKDIRFYQDELISIIKQGIPSGLQNSVISIANVIVQANINAFGSDAMAGCGVYSKIEGFVFLPVTCFSICLATYVSQNVGALKYERVRKGIKYGSLISLVMAQTIGMIIVYNAPTVVSWFSKEPNVINYSVREFHVQPFFYFLLAYSHCAASSIRGLGKPTVPMLVMLSDWCLLRITYITIMVKIIPVIETVFFAYPLTWSISSIIFFFYLKKNLNEYMLSANTIKM